MLNDYYQNIGMKGFIQRYGIVNAVKRGAFMFIKLHLVKDYEVRKVLWQEGLQQGLTHCFFLTFHSDADRDAYLVHPAHKAFGKVLGGKASAVTVLDYWTK